MKSCVGKEIEFPNVLGVVPDDSHLFDCTEAEEPLRVPRNPNDDWVYPVIPTSYPAQFPRAMTEFEYEVGNFRTSLQIPVPPRLIPFVRFTTTKRDNYDFWTSSIEAFDALIEFGASRDKDESRIFLGNLGDLTIQREGRRCNHNIVFDKPMVLDDCTTQDLAICPFMFYSR